MSKGDSMKYTNKCLVKGQMYVLVLIVLATPWVGVSDVRLSNLISDNMVIQRDMPVHVWGWADPCEKVTVKLGESEVAAKADANGNWMVNMAAMAAGGPYEMTVAGKNILQVHNILVGEVWVCSGQSNMAVGIGTVPNGKAEAAAADYPNIRLFLVPNNTAAKPLQNTQGNWAMCSQKSISYGGWQGFSAAAYYFGRELYRELNVPIGLIQSAWGGTRIEPWTPKCGFASVENLSKFVDEIDQENENYKKTKAGILPQYEAWLLTAKAEAKEGKDVTAPPDWPKNPLDSSVRPTGIYNAMINPLIPFRIRGVIWYQGESNIGEAMGYYEKMKALINGWRIVWKEADFPFLFVELAPYNYIRDWKRPTPYDLPEMWEAQIASLAIPNTGMAATTDIGDLNDIHPMNKQDVGKRLALWAMAKTYGREDVVYSGPMYKSMKIEDGKIRLSFDYVNGGLGSRDGKDLNWFEVAGKDKQFVKANARIDGDTVLIWSDHVKEPVAVRFAWNDLAEPNFSNKAGLPALPFRTEKW